MKKINNLVIGSEGFIGKPLCKYLQECGESVAEFDIKRHFLEDAQYRTFDLRDINRVYFLAWDVGGAKYLYSQDTQLSQLQHNLHLLINILPQLQKNKTKFMFVSSHLSDNTDSVYGVTKKLGEVWTKLLGGITIRLWNIYGPYEEPTEKSHVIGDFIHQALSTGNINMMTNGKEVRQFIYIDDLICIMRYIMNNKDGGIYDITTGKWISVYKIAKIISKLTGCTINRGSDKGTETKINPKYLLEKLSYTNIYTGLEKTTELYKEKT